VPPGALKSFALQVFFIALYKCFRTAVARN